MRLRETTIGDAVDFHSHRRIPLSSLEREGRQGEYRYYGAQGVIDHIDAFIFDGEFVLVAEDGANLVTLNEPIAQIAAGQFWVNNHAHVVTGKDSVCNNYYLCTLLNHLDLRGYITGAAQPKLNQRNLRSVRISLPSIAEQAAIVEILRKYDNLIANSKRRIELLEQAARLLFKEWFVQLRYPGHEHDKIVGGVPEGWERKPLNLLTTKIGSGATPRGGEAAYKDGGITLIRSQNVYDYRFELSGLAYIDEQQAGQLANVEVAERDVLLNITGASVGRCCMVPSWCLPARVNQHVMIVRANAQLLCPYFLLSSINSDAIKGFLLSVSSGGATREALTKDLVSRLEILVPSPPIMNAYSELAAPLFEQSEALGRQCRALARARDLLLPRLMDGRISV